jgi:hypothetical protein
VLKSHKLHTRKKSPELPLVARGFFRHRRLLEGDGLPYSVSHSLRGFPLNPPAKPLQRFASSRPLSRHDWRAIEGSDPIDNDCTLARDRTACEANLRDRKN